MTTVADIKRRTAEKIAGGQKLYASIKPSSKYYGQGEKNARFEVFIEPRQGNHCVLGGPGGAYQLSDVYLWVVEGGRELRISA